MMLKLVSMLFALSVATVATSVAKPVDCTIEVMGKLPRALINEASGIAISKQFPNILYHVNDSGDGPNIYVTNYKGEHIKTLSIPSVTARDIEDLAMGPCNAGSDTLDQCIYVADIGDNRRKRDDLRLYVVKERPVEDKKVTLIHNIHLSYPDAPHNAEGFAVHPVSGDMYILTKEQDLVAGKAYIAKLYKLQQSELTSEKATLEFVTNVPVPDLIDGSQSVAHVVTAMDISADGKKLLLLTYKHALELKLDVSTVKSGDEIDFKPISTVYVVDSLDQQEAIAYTVDNNGFIYNTEITATGNDAAMHHAKCGNPNS